MLLGGKGALVTGGGRGLGLVIARALGRAGARVLISVRSDAAGRQAVAELAASGIEAYFVCADVTAADAPAVLTEAASEKLGRLDILVNNAGAYVRSEFLHLSLKDWQETLATNVTAPFVITQAAAKLFMQQGDGGSVINIGSVHASVPEAEVAAQCASKAALAGLTRAAALALVPHGIRVNLIAPGQIEADDAEGGPGESKKVSQDEIAQLSVLLASDAARAITGSVLEAFAGTRAVLGEANP